MSNRHKRAVAIVLGLATIGCGLFLSDDVTFNWPQRSLVKPAKAYIGNPLTPMSYVGVARRTARRNAYSGCPSGYGYPPGYGNPYYPY
jgi:hypothetical protein